MSEPIEERGIQLEKNRLEALTDGIFAFSMTLLVTSLILPRSSAITETSTEALLSLVPDFYHYIIAFFVLSAFWMSHHVQFAHIRSLDKPFLFLNIIGLFFVTVVPFSTSFIGDYSDDLVATAVFEINLLVLGLVFLLQWVYATRGFRLVSPEYPEIRIRFGIWRNLVIPFLSLFGIILAVAGFNGSTMVYLLSPLASWAVGRVILGKGDCRVNRSGRQADPL
jgi:uncharacterized membrane protein